MIVCTPYGYAEVDLLKLKQQLEEEAKQSLKVRQVIHEFVKEKELELKLDLMAKERKE